MVRRMSFATTASFRVELGSRPTRVIKDSTWASRSGLPISQAFAPDRAGSAFGVGRLRARWPPTDDRVVRPDFLIFPTRRMGFAVVTATSFLAIRRIAFARRAARGLAARQ